MGELMKKNKAMEGRRKHRCTLLGASSFIMEGDQKFESSKPPAMLTIPVKTQTAIHIGDLLCNPLTRLHEAQPPELLRSKACNPQSMELASLTGGSQSAAHVTIPSGDLVTACLYRQCQWRFAQGHQTRHWFWQFGSCMHAFHVKKCLLPEIISKQPHLGK